MRGFFCFQLSAISNQQSAVSYPVYNISAVSVLEKDQSRL
jgi:hypothetical protein